MLFTIALLLAGGSLAYATWTAYSIYVHHQQAQCMRVPILISPVGVSNIFWLILQDVLAPHIARLPFGLGSWVRYNRRSWIWQFSDKGRIHQEYGRVIAHVTPTEIQVWIADKDVANEVIKGKDRGLFDKPREEIERIDFLGPHLMTACGETWRRHRKIVATPFTQRNNRIVWTESLHQGSLLGEYWYNDSAEGVTTVWRDNEVVAMNVMVTAGFGLGRQSHRALSQRGTSGSIDLHSALSFMVTQFIWVVLIPSTMWFPKNLPPWPASLRNFFESIRAFKEHLERMVAKSKAAAKTTAREARDSTSYTERLGSDNLLTALVRNSEETRDEDEARGASKAKNSLSDDEIYSNLFGLAFAGHETTAHTLAYSFFLLAAYPDQQAWVAEETRAVLEGVDDVEELDLDQTLPRLVRTRAVMYETLRLFTPLANVLKQTLSSEGVSIQVGSRILAIPPKAFMLPSTYALHAMEEYWGPDSLEWNPKRWIRTDAQGNEGFFQPSPPGAVLPWSDGPGACPGARFSQVEFIAVCTSLLSKFRIRVKCLAGEDEGTAQGRVKAALQDSHSVVTLMPRNPNKIPVALERI